MSFPSLPAVAPARLNAIFDHMNNAELSNQGFNHLNISIGRWLSSLPGLTDRRFFNSTLQTVGSARQIAAFATLYAFRQRIRLPLGANPAGLDSPAVLAQAFRAYAFAVAESYGQATLDDWIYRLLEYYRQQTSGSIPEWVIWINNTIAAATST